MNSDSPSQIWPDIIGTTSANGILHTAMRHLAHNLADMVKHPIEVENLCIETTPTHNLPAMCQDTETEAVGIYLIIEGDLSGEAILILCPEDAMYLSDWLLEKRPGTTTQLNDMEYSALAELGNLTLASFLNSVADLTGTPLRLSPPTVVVDILEVIFEAVAMSSARVSDDLLIIKSDLVSTESSLQMKFWVLPDQA